MNASKAKSEMKSIVAADNGDVCRQLTVVDRDHGRLVTLKQRQP